MQHIPLKWITSNTSTDQAEDKMNGPLVFAENKMLYLDTSMSPSSFSKSGLVKRLDEKGWLAEKSDNGWDFRTWNFTGTKQKKCTDESLNAAARSAQETIMLEGKAFSGRTLKALFDMENAKNLGETERSFVAYATARVCSALEDASKKNIPVYNIGAGGIFISADFQKIIFLPKSLFETSIQCGGKEQNAEYNGYFINPLLKQNAAINYTQSVIAYRILTGDYPFKEKNSEKRFWDIKDHNYVPLKNKIWALNEKLSFFVDNALQRKSQIVKHGKKSGEKKISVAEKISSSITKDSDRKIDAQIFRLEFPLDELYKELGLTEKGEIPAGGHVSNIIRKSTTSPDDFERRVQKENNAFQKKLSQKRWFRKNKTVLTIAFCTILGITFVAGLFINGNLKNPTSKGLTSFQTVEMLYSALNKLDITALQGCTSNAASKNFQTTISNVFVASRMGSTYNVRKTTVPPAQWFCFNYDFNYNIYGVSNFFIDGIDASTFTKGPAKNKKPKAITQEYGTAVAEGSSKDYVVTYSLVFTEEEDQLFILNQIDEVHLLFNNGRWIITGIITNEKSRKEISRKKFVEDFKDAWTKTNNNPKATAKILKTTYDWVPTDLELDGGLKATEVDRNPFSIEE